MGRLPVLCHRLPEVYPGQAADTRLVYDRSHAKTLPRRVRALQTDLLPHSIPGRSIPC